MAEIGKVRGTNGLSVVSTFSGAGGSCLGLEMAGYDLIWSNEFVPIAADVHDRNFPHSPCDRRDIRELTPKDILRAVGKSEGEVDVLNGSPPCSSFSTAGKRDKGWGKSCAYSETEQRTDDLFFEYIRLLRGIKPRAFIAENVRGLRIGVAIGYFKEIFRELEKSGYRVRCQELDASQLGVPQSRKRLIFLGVREDLETDPVFPKPLPYQYTMYDATGITQFRTKPWGKRDRLRIDGRSRPLPTTTTVGFGCGAIGSFHVEPGFRNITLEELRLLSGFPRDFWLAGNSYAKDWERLARAVPPVMMYHIGKAMIGPLGIRRVAKNRARV